MAVQLRALNLFRSHCASYRVSTNRNQHCLDNSNKQVQGTFQHGCHAWEARNVLVLYGQFLKGFRHVICMDFSGNEVSARDKDPSPIPPHYAVLCTWGDGRLGTYPCHQAAFCCNSLFSAVHCNITYDSKGNFTKTP